MLPVAVACSAMVLSVATAVAESKRAHKAEQAAHAMSASLDTAKENVSGLVKEVSRVDRDTQRVSNALEPGNDTIAGLTGDVTASQREMSKVKTDLDQVRSSTDSVKGSFDVAQQDVALLRTDLAAVQAAASPLGPGSFIQDKGAAYVRGGGAKSALHIGDKETGDINVARGGQRVRIGQHTHFGHPNGNTYIRSAREKNGNVILSDIGGQGFHAGHAPTVSQVSYESKPRCAFGSNARRSLVWSCQYCSWIHC